MADFLYCILSVIGDMSVVVISQRKRKDIGILQRASMSDRQ